MTGMSTASPVDTILDKENYTLEELLDEDEIVQECKALNSRLNNFLRERAQVEQLLRYIVVEAPETDEKNRSFKYPFIACEIFTCEVDVILQTLVEEEELMDLLFSFLKPEHSHTTLLAGYFSKLILCLMARRTGQLMNYVKGHQEIFRQLVDLIGITSMMEVLIRLIGADENMYSNYTDTLQWLDGTEIIDFIVDKFSSSDEPEVHANTAEVLCAITRYAPSGLASKVCSPSFVARLFRHALEDSRPKSVLVHSLIVCISILDPKRSAPPFYQTFSSQQSRGTITANPETVDGMLGSLGDLLKLLDLPTSEVVMPTTYGSLNPPLGKHRLKIVEFISVLLSCGNEAAEKEVIRLGAIRQVLDLFFAYPFNNFLHHHVENIFGSCLKTNVLAEHLLKDCDIVGRIIETDKQPTLQADSNKPTLSAEGRLSPRIGNIGHLSRIANKLLQAANTNDIIQTYLQDNVEWIDWHANFLVKRNVTENINSWTCGRPTSLQDRARDSDDDDFRDRDYDVTALATNLSHAFRYNVYSNDDIEEIHGSLERDDEDAYFDDESAEVVISSLRLGDDQDSSSLFTNSNWFAFEDDRDANGRSTGSLPSPSPNSDYTDEVLVGEDEGIIKNTTFSSTLLPNGAVLEPNGDCRHLIPISAGGKSSDWVEWREAKDSDDAYCVDPTTAGVSNGDIGVTEVRVDDDSDLVVCECLLPGEDRDCPVLVPSVSVSETSAEEEEGEIKRQIPEN